MEGHVRILLVEDDRETVAQIRRALAGRGTGFRVHEVGCVGEAREALRRSVPDLVLTEWRLPDGHGVELLEGPEPAACPFVVMTSHGSERDAVAALRGGALDYVVKSAGGIAELPHTVTRALREWRGRLERAEMHEALQRSEERYRIIAESVVDVIWTSDLELRIDFVTPSVERLHGWTVREWRDLRPEDYLEPQSLGRVRRALTDELARHRAGDAPRPVALEVEQVRSDGTTFWTEVTARFLVDGAGRPVGIVGVTRDISGRREIEARLRESEDRLRRIIETIPDAIFIADAAGRFIEVNRAACEQLGYTREELLCRGVHDVVAPAFRERSARRIGAADGPAGFMESSHVRRDGVEVPVELAIIRTMMGGTPCLLGVARDISGRLRAAAERRQLEQQLAQSQRIESVGRLAGGVAHGLNNMLSPILGYAEMIRRDLPASDHLQARVDAILESADRCRDLVQRLLAFARKQTLEMRPLDLNVVVRGFESMLRRTLREDIALETRLGDRLGTVHGDPQQIEQVLLNLTMNAQDAMPEGGRLVIETAEVTLDDGEALAHDGVPPGRHVRLLVRDTGEGMDRETRARAFDPFFTTKEVGKGTGLGLAVVHGIVKQHGGSVEIESEPGRGTSFLIHIPRGAVAVAAAGAAPGPAPETRGAGTVLVVEDEDQVRALAAEILRSQGYVVLEAASGADALAAAAGRAGTIDLLLTDVVLTDDDGRRLHERLTAAGSRHRVLYMTGYTAEVIRQDGVPEAGTVLEKPFTMLRLLEKVRDALGGP